MALSGPHQISSQSINAFLQKILPFLFLIIFILTLNGGIASHMERNPWSIGDWLIGYQDGFVRRGLIGAIVEGISKALQVNPGGVVVAIQAVAYGIFLFFSWRLLRLQKTLIPHLFLIFSPFVFVFQLHDRMGGYRKEILFLALFAFVVWLARHQTPRGFERSLYFLLLCFPLFILSHEMLAIWLPYLLIAYLYVVPITRKRVLILAMLSSLSVAAFAVSVIFTGDAQTAMVTNLSVRPFGYFDLHGAIAWMRVDTKWAIESTRYTAAAGEYWTYYPHVVILCLLAFMPVRKNLAKVLASPWAKPMAFVSLVGSLLICVVGVDWGRFIYASLMPLFFLSLLVDNAESAKTYGRTKVGVFMGLLLIYALAWYVPHAAVAYPYRWPL